MGWGKTEKKPDVEAIWTLATNAAIANERAASPYHTGVLDGHVADLHILTGLPDSMLRQQLASRMREQTS